MAKYTQQQIAEIIIQALEEAKDTAKKNERASAEISRANDQLILKLRNTVLSVDDSLAKETVRKFEIASENAQKQLKKGRETINYISYSIGFALLGLISLFFAFYFGIQSKGKVKDDYYLELKSENKLKSPQEQQFLNNFFEWAKKNPNEKNAFLEKIEQK